MRRLGPAHATSDLVAVRLRYARQLLEGVSRYSACQVGGGLIMLVTPLVAIARDRR